MNMPNIKIELKGAFSKRAGLDVIITEIGTDFTGAIDA